MPALFCVTQFNWVTSNWRSGLRPATLGPALLLYGILRRALAVSALVLQALHGAQAQSGYTVSADQLQQVLAQRFPLRYPVAGLLDLDIQAPHLRLLPEQNRVSAEMAVDAAGPAVRRSHSGTFDVDFALRYEPSDHTIRAYRLKFQNLRISDLQPQASKLLNAYGPALAAQALQEVVLHQLRPQDLAMADNLGMQPDRITVTDKGLVIGFVLKPM